MSVKLAYYRSLTFDEIVALPTEMYNEYLSLLSEESNALFSKTLSSMEDEDSFVDVRGKNNYFFIDISEPKTIYRSAQDMDFHELVQEYAITDSIKHYLLSNTTVHYNAYITPYVCSVCDVLERVICERVVYAKRCRVSKK